MSADVAQRVAIVSAVRTPIGCAGNAYADVHPVDLLAPTLRAAVERSGLADAVAVEQARARCCPQHRIC